MERQRILMKEMSCQMDGLRASTAAERKQRAKAALAVSRQFQFHNVTIKFRKRLKIFTLNVFFLSFFYFY